MITSSGIIMAEKYSSDFNNFGDLINNSQPGISANGQYLVYLEIAPDNTCQLHIKDQINNDYTRVASTDEFDLKHQDWKPSFDEKAGKIYWFNPKYEEILYMDNPLTNN